MIKLTGMKVDRAKNSKFLVEIYGRGLQESAWSPDEAIGMLAKKHKSLWDSKLDTIQVLPGNQDFMAFMVDDDNLFAFGLTETEALGAIIRQFPHRFDTEITLVDDHGE